MKQEIPQSESKTSIYHHSPIPATRNRVSRPRPDSQQASGGVSLSPISKPRLRHSPPETINNSSRTRRPILSNKESKTEDHQRARTAEQFAGGRSRDELQRRLSVSEGLVVELKAEVCELKAQLEKVQSRNLVLETENRELARDLSSAQAKIRDFEKSAQVELASKQIQFSDFKDVRKLIANKLELFPVKREINKGAKATNLQSLAPEPEAKPLKLEPKVQLAVPPPLPPRTPPLVRPPPPPPPPPPSSRSIPVKTGTMQKATSLVEFYHSMAKRDGRKGSLGSEKAASPVASNAHNSIVDELQNRSSHLLAIKADVEKKGDFINHLIHEVQSRAFNGIEDVLTFVDWLDRQLSTLADERAVLKHFNWPERKADALREAAFEYRDLKGLVVEIFSIKDDVTIPCDTILKKITGLLDKSERSIQRLTKLRDTTMISYREYKIPIDWMHDSGMVCKIKAASVKLAKVYIKRVSTELELTRNSERESMQEALLFQGMRFAYRAYQLAGELDSETMRAFEELRELVQLHRRGSSDLLRSVTIP